MKLSDRVWITRKSRIEAASRLEWNSVYSQFLITYFAVFSVIFSILDIRDTTKDYSFQLLIASVITLSVSIFVPSMRFADRALSFKKCYIGLYGLYRKALRAERHAADDERAFEQLESSMEDEYEQLMHTCENHSDSDYLLAIWRLKDAKSTFEISKTQEFRLYLHKAIRFLVVVGLSGIPFFLLFCF